MAWTSSVELYPDRDDVGTVTVVWDKGLPDEATFNLGPWVVTAASKALIVAEANARKAAAATKAATEANLETVLDTAMNA